MISYVLSSLLFALVAFPALAFEIPPNDGFVTDAAGVLSTAEEKQIEDILSAYRSETSNEIAVLIVDSLDGESLADTAVEIGREWGIGTEENDNGILFFIAYNDRELFLATGYGLEGAVPDIVAKGIIDDEIVPHFRDGDYAAGILAGIDALKKHIGGEYTADRYTSSDNESPLIGWVFFIGFVLLQILISIFAKTKSWWLGGVVGAVLGIILVLIFSWWIVVPILTAIGLLLDYIVSKMPKKRSRRGGWWSGGGRGGSSGGGFGGFSGGSFGGGGAGGGW